MIGRGFLIVKRILVVVIILSLVITSGITAYASVDDLDDRGGTESAAGITWDQINEMSQNSPNSLSPIQGLCCGCLLLLLF